MDVTRAVNVKLYSDNDEDRAAIWHTHRLINMATGKFMKLLVLCRGKSYLTRDETGAPLLIPKEDVQTECVQFAREIIKRNGRDNDVSDDDILKILNRFYGCILPPPKTKTNKKQDKDDENEKNDKNSADDGSGKAQAANAFLSPICDAESKGLISHLDDIVDPLPDWVKKMENGTDGWQEESEKWVEGTQAQSIMKLRSRPSKMQKLYHAGEPWQEAFIEFQLKRRATAEVPMTLRNMRDMGLLPLFDGAPIAIRLSDYGRAVSVFDRTAFHSAVSSLAQWETWNVKMADEYETKKLTLADALEVLNEHPQELIAGLRKFESQRHEDLKANTEISDEDPYRLGPSQIRMNKDVKKRWRDVKTADARRHIVNQMQAEFGGDFGDPVFYHWLAQDGNHKILEHDKLLKHLIDANSAEWKLNHAQHASTLTLVDPYKHPKWAMFNPDVGTQNHSPYSLMQVRNSSGEMIPRDTGSGHEMQPASEKNGLYVTLRLLVPDFENEQFYLPQKCTFKMAGTDQLSAPKLTKGKKEYLIDYRSGNHKFNATVMGSSIILDKDRLDIENEQKLRAGRFGDVWFKLVLSVKSKAYPEWVGTSGSRMWAAPPQDFYYFVSSVKAKPNKEMRTRFNNLKPGLRVMTVNLAEDHLADCAVYVLRKGPHPTKSSFPAVPEKDLWAYKERVKLIKLPGEDPNSLCSKARRQAKNELWEMKQTKGFLAKIQSLHEGKDADEREALLRTVLNSTKRVAEISHFEGAISMLDSLRDRTKAPKEEWLAGILACYMEAETALGKHFSEWRKKTKARGIGRPYSGGVSLWAISYLDECYQLLKSFSSRRNFWNERRNTCDGGSFAKSLRDHIQKLKNERTKLGADWIDRIAQGYEMTKEGTWHLKYERCRAIQFSDKTMGTKEKSRRNNRMQRLASYKSIESEVAMQTEIWAPCVRSDVAPYASRFSAHTGAPGIRVRTLTQRDIAVLNKTQPMKAAAAALGCKTRDLRKGMIVPWEFGKEMAFITEDGIKTASRGINHALSMQRALWLRHADAFCVKAKHLENGEMVITSEGLRVCGALSIMVGNKSGTAKLVPDEDIGFRLCGVTPHAHKQLLEKSKNEIRLFRDRSGVLFDDDLWVPEDVFWDACEKHVCKALQYKDA